MLKCTIANNKSHYVSTPPGRSWLKKRSTSQEMNFAIGSSQIWFYIRRCLQHNTQTFYLHAYLCTNTIYMCVCACIYICHDFRTCAFIALNLWMQTYPDLYRFFTCLRMIETHLFTRHNSVWETLGEVHGGFVSAPWIYTSVPPGSESACSTWGTKV